MADPVVLSVILQSINEGTFETVFYEGKVQSPVDFLAAMQSPANIPVFVFLGKEPIGFAWLNGIAGNYAFGHFCFLAKAKGRTVEAGSMLIKYWSSFPSINVLLGAVPVVNDRAIAYVQKLGFTKLGIVPDAVTIAGESADVMLLYRRR